MKRGQASTEYLTIYGWAILVVLIVGIFLWQFGVFSPHATAVTSKGFKSVKPQPTGTRLDHDGTFTGVFINAAGGQISDASFEAGLVMPSQASCTGTATVEPNLPIAAGANFRLTGLRCGGGTIGSVGDTYTLRVSITYNLTLENVEVQRISSGDIRGPLE